MRLRLIGLDYKSAPVALREEFSFSREEVTRFLRQWIEVFPDFEAVLLSTCNRTELYVGSENDALPDLNDVLQLIDHLRRKEDSTLESASEKGKIPPFLHVKDDADAVAHLFSVAASLESMVLGEPQILAQIKDAYRMAAEEGATGKMIHSAFQSALKAAKRVAVETEIFRHRISIPAIAISDFALGIFEKLSDKRTLLLGAGEMAEETLLYLTDQGGKEIVVANRDREKAEKLASKFAGVPSDWDRRFEELKRADLLITATGAAEPVVTADHYREIAGEREGRPLFILDLSVPRNVDENLGKLPNVYLYSIDDLKDACDRNRKSRNQEIPKANRILRQETENFMKEIRLRDSGELIRELRDQWNRVKESEVERLFRKCPELPESDRTEIRYAFDRLVNKLLHPPMESLRDETADDRPIGLLEAMMKLFRLK